jgi:hypothetical protein
MPDPHDEIKSEILSAVQRKKETSSKVSHCEQYGK